MQFFFSLTTGEESCTDSLSHDIEDDSEQQDASSALFDEDSSSLTAPLLSTDTALFKSTE